MTSREGRFQLADIVVIQIISAVLLLSLAILFQGTGDDGDSVLHFLKAKYAPTRPELFFDHWGKPFYTLLAFPWAQFGFFGIKLFNIVNILLAQYWIYCIAERLQFRFAWLPSLLYILCPISTYYTLSGLTEPLFANLFSLAVLLIMQKRIGVAMMLMSFLPFVRSEGLIVVIISSVYLLFEKQFKYIPYLALGHLLYAIAGMSTYDGDFLWPFTKIPYPADKAFYGKGPWFHFTQNMPQVTGILGAILLWLGCCYVLVLVLKFFKRELKSEESVFLFFIYGSFLGFLFFHSYAWACEKFNSFGLVRVFIAVLPMMAVIMTQTVEWIYNQWKFKYFNFGLGLYLFLISILLFAPNHKYSASFWKFSESSGQLAMKEAVDFISQSIPKWKDQELITSSMNYYFYSNQDPDRRGNSHISAIKLFKTFKRNTILIWDDWYSVIEHKVQLEDIRKDSLWQELKTIECTSDKGNKSKAVIFQYHPQDEYEELQKSRTEEIIQRIKSDPSWLKHVEEKAIKNKITTDSMLILDALYLINTGY